MIEFSFSVNGKEAMAKAGLLAAVGYHVPPINDDQILKCSYRFFIDEHSDTHSPQRIIDILDHMRLETFQISAIDLYQLNRHIETLQNLLRLAEKMRTMARFVPSELPKPEPEPEKSWWKKLWS